MNDNIDYCHHDSKTLNTSYYQVLNGGRSSGKTFQTINMYQEKYDKLQSNWNSLREWLKTDEQKYFTFQPRQNGKTLQAGIKVGLDMALDKMNELEGKDKNGIMDKKSR